MGNGNCIDMGIGIYTCMGIGMSICVGIAIDIGISIDIGTGIGFNIGMGNGIAIDKRIGRFICICIDIGTGIAIGISIDITVTTFILTMYNFTNSKHNFAFLCNTLPYLSHNNTLSSQTTRQQAKYLRMRNNVNECDHRPLPFGT